MDVEASRHVIMFPPVVSFCFARIACPLTLHSPPDLSYPGLSASPGLQDAGGQAWLEPTWSILEHPDEQVGNEHPPESACLRSERGLSVPRPGLSLFLLDRCVCTHVCTAFVSMHKRMYMCVYVYPPSISSGTPSVFSVHSLKGAEPIFTLSRRHVIQCLVTGDSSLLGHRKHSIGKLDLGVPLSVGTLRKVTSGTYKHEGTGCPPVWSQKRW